jgi:DNA repair exonuclease SbcCD ATPase subunit
MGDANPAALYNRADSVEFTQDQLEEYFNEEGSGMLRQAFGSFSNYLGYMTEREQLIQSGDYDVGDWPDYQGGLTDDQLMLLEGEDLTQFGDDATADQTELEKRRLLEQSSAYDRWINSEANQALLRKYGVDGTMYNSDGDSFKWNGSAYVKTNKIDDSVNIGEIATLGMAIALSIVGTPAIAAELTPLGAAAGSAAAMSANATASSIMSLATQLLTTGQIDPEGALRAAATSFLSDSVMKSLRDSGIFGQIGDAANSSTTDQLIDADGNVIGQIVRDSAGNVLSSSGVSANEWFTYASELGATINEGQTLISQIASVLPEVPDWLYDAAQTTVDAVDRLFEETRAGTGGQGGEGTVFGPIAGGGRDIFTGDDGADEETPVEEDQEPDILASTIDEDVIRTIFDEEITQIEAELEDQNTGLEGIQTAVGEINEQQQEALRVLIDARGDINQLDENQQQIISSLGGIDQVLTTLGTSVGELELADAAIRGDIAALEEYLSGRISEQGEENATALSELEVRLIGDIRGSSTELQNAIDGNTTAITQLGEDFEEEISNVRTTLLEAIGQIEPGTSGEEVRSIIADVLADLPDGLSEEEMQDVRDVVASVLEDYEFPVEFTDEQIEQVTTLVNDAVSGLATTGQLDEAIGSLEARLDDLPPEIRAIVAEEIDNLATRGDVSAVQQSINALEQLVNNIQPGTTPEQVRQEIQDAGLATSEELQTTAEGLFAALEAMAEGQTVALTTAQSEMLAEIAEGDAETIRELSQLEGRLEDYLEEQNTSFTEVTSELSDDIENLRVGLSEAEQDRQRLMEAIVEARGETTELSQEMRDLLAESNQTIQEMFEDAGVDIDELRSGQLSQEEATNALREYSEQTRQELRSGLDEASEERLRIEESTNDKLEQLREGIAVQFTDAEARRLEELTGLEARLLQDSAENAAEFNDLLANQGIRFEEVTDALRSDILESEERLGDRITGLEQQMDADAIARLAELTGLRTEFLETLTANEAAAIARNEGLSDQITEQITGIRGETARQIEGMDERLNDRINDFEEQTGSRFDSAAEEREQIREDLAENLIAVDGRFDELTEAQQQQFEELGITVEDLERDFGIRFDDLTSGLLSQTEALESLEGLSRDRFDTLEGQIEESRAENLSAITGLSQDFLQTLSDAEARLLEADLGLRDQLATFEEFTAEELEATRNSLFERINEAQGQFYDELEATEGRLGEGLAGLGNLISGPGGLGQQVDALAAGQEGLNLGLGQLGGMLGGRLTAIEGRRDVDEFKLDPFSLTRLPGYQARPQQQFRSIFDPARQRRGMLS